MGLDNGIVLKYPKKISGCVNSDEFINKVFPDYLGIEKERLFSYEQDDVFEIEVAY